MSEQDVHDAVKRMHDAEARRDSAHPGSGEYRAAEAEVEQRTADAVRAVRDDEPGDVSRGAID